MATAARDVILTAVRWYLAYPLSSRQVLELLAERGIDVSHRTVLNWVQACGPQPGAEVRRQRHPVGRRWFVDEVFLSRKSEERYRYRAIDEDDVVVDVLLLSIATRPVCRPSFARPSSTPG